MNIYNQYLHIKIQPPPENNFLKTLTTLEILIHCYIILYEFL